MSSSPSSEAEGCEEETTGKKGEMVREAGSQPIRLCRPVLVLAGGKGAGLLQRTPTPTRRKHCRVGALAELSSQWSKDAYCYCQVRRTGIGKYSLVLSSEVGHGQPLGNGLDSLLKVGCLPRPRQ